jgi:hypothetical protein
LHSQGHKNDDACKKSVLSTPQKWLNIFENSFIQIEAMEHIFYFYNPEWLLIELWLRSSQGEKLSRAAYITRAGSP